mgnify:CR=1 FL=1
MIQTAKRTTAANTRYCKAWRESHRKAYNAYMSAYKRKRRQEARKQARLAKKAHTPSPNGRERLETPSTKPLEAF